MQRSLLSLLLTTAILAVSSGQVWGQSYSLQSKYQTGDQSRISCELQVGGDLKVTENNKVETIPMSVVAQLVYGERLLSKDNQGTQLRSIRHYDQTKAVIKVAQATYTPELRPTQQLILATYRDKAAALNAAQGPLTREEYDLLKIVGNSLLVEQLLPTDDVAIGDSWKHDEAILNALLCIDASKSAEVNSTLTEVDGDLAKISLDGTIEGAVGGIATELTLKGRYNFDQKLGRITWFALSIKENRAIGHVGPGLDVVAQLRMRIEPGAQTPQLSDQEVAQLPLEETESGTTILSYQPANGPFQFFHDSRWHFTREDQELTIMRLVDRGEFIAQCNISALQELPAGQKVALNTFQADIKRSLGENFGQFLQATESTSPEGKHILRVVVAGMVSELPIQWNYYLITAPEGQRLSIAFTLEQELIEKFAEADQSIIQSLQFSPTASTARSTSGTTR